ncbi:hypothetical protein, partial [Saccharothrix sp. ST-888]|uniref:hypothetical protein n=1 Tax=Saccharothrix sp. ST-888 TaxID=1427391 RepID=UPI0012E07205
MPAPPAQPTLQPSGGSDGVQPVNLATVLAAGFAPIDDVLPINLCANTTASGRAPPHPVISAPLHWTLARRTRSLA